MENSNHKNESIEVEYLNNVGKNKFLMLKNSFLKLENRFIELKVRQLKEREIKIKREIEVVF